MERVQGVGRNAIILFAGILAGLFFWFQFVSSPSNADAAANVVNDSSMAVELQLPPDQIINLPIRDTLPDLDFNESTGANPLPAVGDEILSAEQRQHLIDVSKKYIALTTADGIKVARSLKFVKEYGNPTNVCGPLSIAILRDAGIVDPYVKVGAFWLLSPNTNRKLLEQTFPQERYDHYQFAIPLDEMDWAEFPLKPGDFLYLYAGKGGTFEHMLVVSRVDAAGRAFSVTNHATPDGFVIDEILLYDPAHPGTGKFYEWTDRRNNKLGTTGLGGFELWRLARPLLIKSPRDEGFARELDSVMDQAGGDWYVTIRGLNGGLLYDRQADVQVDAGSLIKLPVALLFFKSLEAKGVKPDEYGSYLKNEGPGLTYDQLLRSMIKRSDLTAAQKLMAETRLAGINVDRILSQWGLRNTNLEFGKISARDLATLYGELYSGKLVDPTARAYILSLMNENGADRYNRLGILHKTNPSSLQFYNYRGSTLDTIVAIGDSALVLVPAVDGEDAYLVVMMGFPGEDHHETDEDLISAIEDMTEIFWGFAQK